MAVKWIDGFEADATQAAMEAKYENTSFVSMSNFPAGRYHGRGFGRSSADGSGNSARFRTPSLGLSSTWIVAFNLYGAEIDLDSYVSLVNGTSEQMRFQVLDAGDGTGDFYLLGKRGTVELLRTPTIQRQSWHRFELKVVLDSSPLLSAGSVEIRVDESTVASVTGVRTADLTNSFSDKVEVKLDTTSAGTSEEIIDDILVCDGASEVATFDGFTVDFGDFVGELVVESLYVDSAGSSTQLTPNAGANWDRVDDVDVRDGDTTYVSGSGAGLTDLYGTRDLDFSTGHVLALQLAVHARLESAGLRTVKHAVRVGGSTTKDAGHDITSTSYQYTWSIWPRNPTTTMGWLPTDLALLEIGEELV